MTFREKIKNNKVTYKLLKPLVINYRNFKVSRWDSFKFHVKTMLKTIAVIKPDPVLKKLENLYRNKGKKAFVIATGPSLRIADLEKISKDDITISVNGIWKLFDKTNWRPNYYVMDDKWVYLNYIKNGQFIKLEELPQKETIVSNQVISSLRYKPDRNRMGKVDVYYADHWLTHYSKYYGYISDLNKGYYDLYTVTSLAIELAIYMGFKKIYLLGVDCSYTGAKLHAGEDKRKTSDIDFDDAIGIQRAMIKGYDVIKEYADANNVIIKNATRGGQLEVFERVDFDSLFV